MYYIKIKTQFEGFHKYEDAPDSVMFLRDYHRHLFNVEVKIKTNHANRDIEFFIIKDLIDKYLVSFTGWKEKFAASCEQVAESLFMYLKGKNLKVVQVEVQEDQENIGGYYE